MNLDLDFVRSQFPAFREPWLAGYAPSKTPAVAYACGQVIDWLDRYYRQTKVQPYYAFAASAKAGEQMDGFQGAHGRLAQRRQGRNPFRSFDVSEHFRSRPGPSALPQAGRRNHRH